MLRSHPAPAVLSRTAGQPKTTNGGVGTSPEPTSDPPSSVIASRGVLEWYGRVVPAKFAGVVAAVFGAALLFAPAGHAQSGSLNLEQTTPVINFDFDGRIRYIGDVLEVDATPLFAQVQEFLPPAPISDGVVLRDFVIRVHADNAGNLLGSNIPGEPDLVIQGRAKDPAPTSTGSC